MDFRRLNLGAVRFCFYLYSKRMVIVEESYVKASCYTEGELLLEIAVMLFEKERLSLRKAASLAQLHWLDFMKELDKREIALHYDETLL